MKRTSKPKAPKAKALVRKKPQPAPSSREGLSKTQAQPTKTKANVKPLLGKKAKAIKGSAARVTQLKKEWRNRETKEKLRAPEPEAKTTWLTQPSKAERKAKQKARQAKRAEKVQETVDKVKARITRKAEPSEIKDALARVGLTPDIKEPKTGLMESALRKKGYSPVDVQKIVEGITPLETFDYSTVCGEAFKPSVQQSILFDWVRIGKGNAFVRARAGTGKTTSLLQACRFMTGTIICIAFNVSIRREFEAKLVEFGLQNKVEVKTVHAVGNGAIRRDERFKGTTLCINYEKRDAMLDFLRPEMSAEFPPYLRTVVPRLVSLAKQTGVLVTWELGDLSNWDDLIEHYNVSDLLPDNGMDTNKAMADAVRYAQRGITWSRKIAPKMIDFDDQIWLALVENLRFFKFDWVLIDEAQDLNLIRMLIADRLMHDGSRLVAVGDENQAIYGFTGADSEAIAKITERFKCAALPLTVTYRCGDNIVKEAQRFVPDIQSAKPPGSGIVTNMSAETFEKDIIKNLTCDDAIICRKNRPNVSLAFRLIRMGIPCHVEGRSIGEGLITLTKKWKSVGNDLAKFTAKLDEWHKAEGLRLEAKKKESQLETLHDKVETLQIIMEGCETLDDVRVKIMGMFKDSEGNDRRTVILSSVHKFKGRERKRVFILGYHEYMPSKAARMPWELVQEDNLRYVAITRAIDELVYLEALDDDHKKK